MSNGWHGCGSANADINDTKGTIGVQARWSSSSNWVELTCRPHDADRSTYTTIYLDKDNGDAVELAVALLRAVDAEEMAEQLEQRSTVLVERAAAREQAEQQSRAAVEAARDAFLAATEQQRQTYLAAVAGAEQEYEAVTGDRVRMIRSITLAEDDYPF